MHLRLTGKRQGVVKLNPTDLYCLLVDCNIDRQVNTGRFCAAFL
jgi:hypothetical protein